MTTANRIRIAHESLCLLEAPYLRHYRGGFRLWNGVAFTRSMLPGAGFNFAAVLGPAPELDAILLVAREFFGGQAHGILVEADAGHPVEAEMKSRGWSVEEDEPAFVMERIDATPPAMDELHITRVSTHEDEMAFLHAACAAFGMPPEAAETMRPAESFVGAENVAYFLGRLAGQVVSVSGYSRSGDTAVISGVATLEPQRGRGYGAALTRAALAYGASRGCTSAVLRSGPLSRPLYERLGFQYACHHRTYSVPQM